MSVPSKMEPGMLYELILNVREPTVVSGIEIPWYFFNETLEDWLARMHTKLPDVQFQLSSQKYGCAPQMEYERETSPEVNFGSFLEYSRSPKQENKWATFSYKYLKDFKAIGDDGNVNMGFCGFPEIQDDISFWLGSHGAHTPCHYDTFGRNVVVQVYGHKRWILFNHSDLKPTRIPYEESSVFSTLPFFSPKHPSDYLHLGNRAYLVDLNPGDILIVPPKWWHYVESLDASLAINAWIPIAADKRTQIDEFLVKYQVMKLLPDDLIDQLVFSVDGQKDLRDFKTQTDEYRMKILEFLVKMANDDSDSDIYGKFHTDNVVLDPYEIEMKYSKNSQVVKKCGPARFMEIIRHNCKQRFCPEMEKKRLRSTEGRPYRHCVVALIESFCKPDIIATVSAGFIKHL